MLARIAPHLHAARARAAALVEVPQEPGTDPHLVPVPVFGDGARLDVHAPPAPHLAAKVSLWTGNILSLAVDAVVCPAPPTLLPSGMGLHARVHGYGGPVLVAQLESFITPRAIGDVLHTDGGDLPAAHVVHAVAPKSKNNVAALAPTYDAVLAVVKEQAWRTVALACLGTGESGTIPEPMAGAVAVRAVRMWLDDPANADTIDRIVFVAHTARQQEVLEQALQQAFPFVDGAGGAAAAATAAGVHVHEEDDTPGK